MPIILLIILLLTPFTVIGQTLTAHKGEVANGYDYWLYTPDNSIAEETEPKPVIIFLHGASLCGRNLEKVKRYGTIDAIEKGRKLDAYIIAPQNPGGSWNPVKVMNVLDYVSDYHNVDYDRVYVAGMSLGGFGTIDLAATYPDRIAAAMAICGGGTVADLSPLAEVPLWIVHGTADRAVSISQSDKVADKIKESDPDASRLAYDRVEGWTHGTPARLFYLPETYEWLLSHTLKDPERNISDTFTLDNALLRTAYTGLRSMKVKGNKKRRTPKRAARLKK